jgi:hypothetical protein
MANIVERLQTAWASGDPLALHREVEQMAGEGHSRQALEDALVALLLRLRNAGADDDTEEIVNGVLDRLMGWCHASRQIGTTPRKNESSGLAVPPVVSPPPSTASRR